MRERVARRIGVDIMRPLTAGGGGVGSPPSRSRIAASVAGLLAAAALAGGCGGKATGTDAGSPAGSSPSASASGMAMPSGMAMGDPSTTPADKIEGADLKKGDFKLLDTRPPGSDTAAGTAWLAQNDKGTTVTITMTGLKPGEKYMAHLHAQACAKDNGGPHFKFDPAGPAMPPNEVHLGFTADGAGKAMVTVHNDRKVGDGARAVVVHPMEAMDNRLACADF
jgi:Cu/Zn superoxide dismutase